MKKREFLAMSGAVPLMLAGCGDGTGSAPVRLVNASVGYPLLGFMVQTTEATTADVAYGDASPFETVQAGSVTTALTVTTGSTVTAVSSTTRSLSKDSRYSLVAYGFEDELKSLLVTESTVTPDTGKANINVLNTSLDIGAVDIYLAPTAGSTAADLALATQIASSVGGETQSTFFPMLPGAYYITVVGAGSIAAGVSDVRFTSSATITLTDQEIVTVILTPGVSGTLANVIVLVQGTSGTTTSFLNTTARLRVVTAVPATTTVAVTGVLTASAGPQPSNYAVVSTGAVPTATVGSTTITPTGTLVAGGDYTLLVYTDSSGNNPTTVLNEDDNTAPVGTTGVKYRLINLAYNNTGLTLRMAVNSINVASSIAFPVVSAYTEIATPQTVASVVQVFDGASLLVTEPSQILIAGNSFTECVVSVSSDTPPVVASYFLSAVGV